MRSVAAIIACFAAMVAASPVARRQLETDYGCWDVNVTTNSAANGYTSRDVSAKYSNQDSTVHCTYSYLPGTDGAITESSCTDPSFSYDLGSTNFALTQMVTVYGENVTISGEGELIRTCGGATGHLCTGSALIKASTAVV